MGIETQEPAALAETTGQKRNNSAANSSKKIRPNTKEFAILKVLASGKSLNRFEAIRLHDTALNSTISTLQSKGLLIDRVFETVPCVNGTKQVTVCRYSLSASELPKARQLLGIDTVMEVAA